MRTKKIINGLVACSFLLGIVSCDDDLPTPDPGSGDCNDEILMAPYNSGLVAYYKFVSGSVSDYSGNGHDGSITGSVISTSNPSGSADCAMEFPGTNTDYISIPSHSDFDFDETTELSIVLWYKPVYVPGTAGVYRLLIGRDPGTGLRCPDTYGEYSLGTYDCMKPVFGLGTSRVWDESFNPLLATYCDSLMMDYENSGWQNLIAIFDPSEPVSKWKIYRNGVMTADGSSICDIPYTTVYNGNLVIGKNFIGAIDDIKVYNRVLTTSEITFLKDYVSPCCE